MSDNGPTTDSKQETSPVERPPFNEVSVLFPLLTFYTVVYLGLIAAEFFLRGAFILPPGLMPVYIALTAAYAADKEIRRWAGTPEPPRKGSFFVYLWLLFYLVAFMIRSFRPEFGLPAELGNVVLQVLGIFFGSRTSKYIWEARRTPDTGPEKTDDGERQAKILDMIKAQGQVTNREVADALHVSAASAKRILADLVDRGQIRLMGEKRGAFYVLIPGGKPLPVTYADKNT
ncbi:MAG: winged helix-turn-helix transcriptional regulator [Kiritimatiellaeota bacterium]|nr:winged helix-turn-helix transcriptional regulator [Kiritimatiellota bacterium]